MKFTLLIYLVLYTAVVSGGCAKKYGPVVGGMGHTPTLNAPPAYPGTMEGLKRYLDDIRTAHFQGNIQRKVELTRLSMPTLQDIDAVLTEEGRDRLKRCKVERMLKHYTSSARKLRRIYRMGPAQTGFYINSATTAELVTGRHNLPGGMNRIARFLKPGLKWYRVKFVRPGRRLGRAYTAFAFLNNRWIFFMKPWRFIKRRAGMWHRKKRW